MGNKNKIVLLFLALGMISLNACKKDEKEGNEIPTKTPVVGDESMSNIGFSKSITHSSNLNSEYPTFMNGNGIVWASSPNPSRIKFAELTSNYVVSGDITEIIENTGALSGPNDIDLTGVREEQTKDYLLAYIHGQNGSFALKGKVFNASNTTNEDFLIEGVFLSANERPRYPKLAQNGSGDVAIVYHSSSGTSSPSQILFKTINISSEEVSPEPETGTQTGHVISGGDNDALFPSIAWNEETNVYGVVYMIGTGNNRQIRYVAVDESGSVVNGPTTITNGNGFETQNPKIKADNDGFVVSWRDFRTIIIGDAEPIQGVPAIRLKKINSSGTTIELDGTKDIYDNSDHSLLVSNPYTIECGMYHDIVVKEEGSKYGLAFATQTSPYQIYFSEVENSGGELTGSVQKNISNSNLVEDRIHLVEDNGNYVIFLTGQKSGGTGYEIRRLLEN